MCALRIAQTMTAVPLMNAKPSPPGTHVLDPAALGDHLDRLYRSARARCRSREGAEDLHEGDVLAIPSGVPHQFTDGSDPLLYFVVKVEA